MPALETFHGFVETTADTLLIFEACRRGIFPKINRRLQERERGTVRSGTVFVFDEKESGIKRWTDGLVWSPSRILGNFLIYRELESRESSHGKRITVDRRHSSSASYGRFDESVEDDALTGMDRSRERALVGSLTNSYKFKKGGLIKKTMSIVVNGSSQHLISYYTKEDVLNNRLPTPSSIPELASLNIAPELWVRQSFRVPPAMDGSDAAEKTPLSPSSTISSLSPTAMASAPFAMMQQQVSRQPLSQRRRAPDVSELTISRKASRTSFEGKCAPTSTGIRSSVVLQKNQLEHTHAHAYNPPTPDYSGPSLTSHSPASAPYAFRYGNHHHNNPNSSGDNTDSHSHCGYTNRGHSMSSEPIEAMTSMPVNSSMLMGFSYAHPSSAPSPSPVPSTHPQVHNGFPMQVQYPSGVHPLHRPCSVSPPQQQHQQAGAMDHEKHTLRPSSMGSPMGYPPVVNYQPFRKESSVDGSPLPSPSSTTHLWQMQQPKTPPTSQPFHHPMLTAAYEPFSQKNDHRFNPIPSPSFVPNHDVSFFAHQPQQPSGNYQQQQQSYHHYRHHSQQQYHPQHSTYSIKPDGKQSSSASLANLMHSSSPSSMSRVDSL